MEIWVLLLLILGSGLLAMAEMAIGASRDSHLAQRAAEGEPSAHAVIQFRRHPSRLLATTQLGITVMAMLAGAFGESLWVPCVESGLNAVLPVPAGIAYALALGLVVSVITFFSLVFGEVIPKRLALARPETVAIALSGPVNLLLRLTRPLVWAVSVAADRILDLFPVNKVSAEASAADEIRFLIESGRKAGSLDSTESEILGNVFRLDNRRVAAIMTPAAAIAYLDLELPREANMQVLEQRAFSRYLVCKGGIANALGFVEARELLRLVVNGQPLDFGKLSTKPPHYVPSSLSLIELLDFLKERGTQVALVVNEFGATEGLVTVSDLIGTVVGDVLSGAVESPLAIQRDDGSWLLDGLLPLDELKDLLGLPDLPAEELGNYHTAGGFVIYQLGRIPKKTENFVWSGWRFEVMDMDRNRVDEVLAKRIDKAAEKR
ncbi:MAG: hemolysin family protein [Rhodocyclaceae bacterium]|nr:hemolysin family protein [Rhodocyclaceae bacterium]